MRRVLEAPSSPRKLAENQARAETHRKKSSRASRPERGGAGTECGFLRLGSGEEEARVPRARVEPPPEVEKARASHRAGIGGKVALVAALTSSATADPCKKATRRRHDQTRDLNGPEEGRRVSRSPAKLSSSISSTGCAQQVVDVPISTDHVGAGAKTHRSDRAPSRQSRIEWDPEPHQNSRKPARGRGKGS